MKKEIPYHPELRELIPSLGFESSSKLFNFLNQCGIGFFYYDRIYTSEDRIVSSIEDLRKMRNVNEGFIFVMSVVDLVAIDVIYIDGISKEEMIKYLQLKVFS